MSKRPLNPLDSLVGPYHFFRLCSTSPFFITKWEVMLELIYRIWVRWFTGGSMVIKLSVKCLHFCTLF